MSRHRLPSQRSRWRRWAVPAVVVAVVAGTGSAVAASSGTPVTVYGCVHTGGSGFSKNQIFDVSVTAPPACPSGSYAINWQGNSAPSPSPSPSATSPSATPTTTPTPSSPSPSPTPIATAPGACVTSAENGSCGPYDSYAGIMNTTSSTYIGNDVWNQIPGASQTLTAYSPGNWSVTANMPAGNTAVVSYPSIGANYGEAGSDYPTPLSDYSSITSTFSEHMNATAATSGWAMYDIWLGPATGTSATNEVMIQTDFADNGPCTFVATANFGGQTWGLCDFGTTVAWKLTGANESAGTVDILAMLNWLVTNGYLPSSAGLYSVGYGWEICSTGGVPETFQVNGFTLSPVLAG